MFNAQMKLKINEREATEFWMRFEVGEREARLEIGFAENGGFYCSNLQ
jgi:hypothetical protein